MTLIFSSLVDPICEVIEEDGGGGAALSGGGRTAQKGGVLFRLLQRSFFSRENDSDDKRE